MISLRSHRTTLSQTSTFLRKTAISRKATVVIGVAAMAALAGSAARSGELMRTVDRCGAYGADFVDLGNGTCGRITGRSLGGGTTGWTGSGTANAGLRSDGYAMLPGAGNARHLRIQVDPDFR